MYDYSAVVKEVSILDGVTCDRCGFRCDLNDPSEDVFPAHEFREFLKINHHCGRGSRIAGGYATHIEAELCQDCWWDVLGKYCRTTSMEDQMDAAAVTETSTETGSDS